MNVITTFSRSASALPHGVPGDNSRMAATAEEGTARMQVSPVNARTQRKSLFKGDSRKDGTEKMFRAEYEHNGRRWTTIVEAWDADSARDTFIQDYPHVELLSMEAAE